jgi:hypothetical protein
MRLRLQQGQLFGFGCGSGCGPGCGSGYGSGCGSDCGSNTYPLTKIQVKNQKLIHFYAALSPVRKITRFRLRLRLRLWWRLRHISIGSSSWILVCKVQKEKIYTEWCGSGSSKGNYLAPAVALVAVAPAVALVAVAPAMAPAVAPTVTLIHILWLKFKWKKSKTDTFLCSSVSCKENYEVQAPAPAPTLMTALTQIHRHMKQKSKKFWTN